MLLRPVVYSARWVLPVLAPPIRDGAVLVGVDGRILEVRPRAFLEAPAEAEWIELGEAALLPGLVNLHAHPELTGLRGLLDDLPFHAWIPALMRAKRAAEPTQEEYVTAALWGCLEAILAGITTTAATEASGASLEALTTAGLRGVVYREVFGPDPAVAPDAIAELRRAVEVMRGSESERVRVGISPHAPYTVSDRLYQAAAHFAEEEALPVAVHIAEAEVETQLVREGAGPFAAGLRTRAIATPPRGRSPIELLDRLGVLRTRPLLIHCVAVDVDDRARIADQGATVAHCPIASARLGHGVAPVVELLEAGVTVGLGTDSVASNNRLDLLEEARVAQLLQRVRLRSAGALDSERLLRMVTLEGARALGLEARVGSLERGKSADLCAIGLDAPHVRPVHDPLAAIFHSARGSDVVLTVVEGRPLMRDRQVLAISPSDLEGPLMRLAARLAAAVPQAGTRHMAADGSSGGGVSWRGAGRP